MKKVQSIGTPSNSLKKLGLWLIFLAFPLILLAIISHFYSFGLNETISLSNQLFIIKKRELPELQDKYIVFQKLGNKRYGDKTFIKLIGGRANDLITVEGRKYFINGEYVGTAKPTSKTGEPMELTPAGVIPEGYYFAYSLHKDSYDSKYQEFGLVATTEVIGVAYAIF